MIHVYIVHLKFLRMFCLGLTGMHVHGFVGETFTHVRMRQYDASGAVSNTQALLKEMGFEINSFVIRKDKVRAQIIGFDATNFVVLRLDDDNVTGDFKVDAKSFIQKEWQTYTPKAKPQYLGDLAQHAALNHNDAKISLLKAKIIVALHAAMQSSTCVIKPESLKIRTKPKGVLVEQKFTKHSLKLIPFSNKVECKESGDTKPTASIWVCSALDSMDFYVAPMSTIPKQGQQGMIAPFWFIAPTHDADMANMELFVPSTKAAENIEQLDVKISYMRNIKPVAAGDELFYFKGKSPKPLELEELVPHQALKRLKTKTQVS